MTTGVIIAAVSRLSERQSQIAQMAVNDGYRDGITPASKMDNARKTMTAALRSIPTGTGLTDATATAEATAAETDATAAARLRAGLPKKGFVRGYDQGFRQYSKNNRRNEQ
jgi:hypothetical protein